MGIKVNEEPISNIRYADDTVLIANNIEELQNMYNKINEISKHYGLNINAKKTKFMIVSRKKNPYTKAKLEIDNKHLEIINQYCMQTRTQRKKSDAELRWREQRL